MKKQIVYSNFLKISVLSLLTGTLQAQNTFPTSGNVGIGTTNPWAVLHVNNPNLSSGTFLNISGTAPGVLFNTSEGQDTNVAAIGLSTANGHYINSSIAGQLNIRGGVLGDVVFGTSRADGSYPELMRLATNGNLGIGTNTPSEKLDVNGSLKVQGKIRVGTSVEFIQSVWGSGFGTRIIGADYGNGNTSLNFDVRANSTTWTTAFKIGSNGDLFVEKKLGIGTNTPSEKLDVNGSLKVQGDATIGNNLLFGGTNSWILHTPDDGRTNLTFAPFTNGTWDWSKRIYFRNDGTGIFKNIGIGTDNPDEKLTVKGKIHAEELIVDLQVPADYVFEKYYSGISALKSDYKMPTLSEVEQFTRENNHLPNVPSAKEIQEKGLHVGEMSNILLQKIEELTLYMIELKKENEFLKKEIEVLKIEK